LLDSISIPVASTSMGYAYVTTPCHSVTGSLAV